MNGHEWCTIDQYHKLMTVSLFHDLLEEIVQRSVTVRHHDRPLIGEGVVDVADHLHGHIGLT